MFIVVGVSGGIAAYKAVQLVRSLVQLGHEVYVVPTEDALRFVGMPTWEAISRNAVTTSVHEDVASVRHVALGQRADLVVVAPATANTLARITAGLADDLLGTTLLATTAPVLVAPAMHSAMWEHPSTQQNITVLRARGVHVIGPESGALTGEDAGVGRMSEPQDIAAAAHALLTDSRDLSGLRVLVTAGGTREPLDPVRFLGNRSSGKQGVALALAAADRGASVILLAANIDRDASRPVAPHPSIRVERVTTALELRDAAKTHAADADVIVMAAAVADYRPASVSTAKITKEDAGSGLTIELVENPDIVAELCRERAAGQTIVAFAAETGASHEERLARAQRKRARKGADMIVLNEVGWESGFEVDENSVTVIGADDHLLAEATGSKRETAEAVWDAIAAARRAGAQG